MQHPLLPRLVVLGVLFAWLPIASLASYDAQFACCGGCSSSKRADAHNDKLQTGSRIFIWDIKLKTSPSETCLLTFPYDLALNEQEGNRRVRSGRLVGTSYPIDHDYDALCCEQRGLCQASEEDATGKCHCVKKWGFTGDHCEDSLYDVAERNNSAMFPAATDLTNVERLLPDLRSNLAQFDLEAALQLSSTQESPLSSASQGNLLSVFELSANGDLQYRQYAWTMCGYFVLAAVFFALLFLFQLLWSFCLFKCRCRKKDPRKQPKIYSQATKLFWGISMCVFLAIGTGASVFTFVTVQNKLLPRGDAIAGLLGITLPSQVEKFQTSFLKPFDQVLLHTESPNGLSLAQLQEKATHDMAPHTFLDAQSVNEDTLSKPVFTLLDGLQAYSALYPTVNTATPAINCAKMNITPSIVSRMTIGATTGCFRCKTCSLLTSMVDDAKDRWHRNAYKAQLDLRQSREQLLQFGATQTTLTKAIELFRGRVNHITTLFLSQASEAAARYKQLDTEARNVVVFGLFGLMGLNGCALAVAVAALSVGIATNKRPLARSTCFIGEIACIVALVLVGVLYSVAMMASDGITTLDLLNRNVSTFVNDQIAAQDITRTLWDHSLVMTTGMNETLAFADTLRVPPHPTPFDDDPARFDSESLYDLPELFALESQVRDYESARISLFGWDPGFVQDQYVWLHKWAFGNATVVSPYNVTLHQDLLNSTALRLMDPDGDNVLSSSNDLLYIQSVFNETWRGVDDRGMAQNELIVTQWLFMARLEVQKGRLDQYLAKIADVISSPRPLLNEFIQNTSQLEAAEFEVKKSVEFFTDALRKGKLRDCTLDGNCAWFRKVVNELFIEFQELLTHAEFAAICCAVAVVALLMGLICAGCFANRLRRKVVKVYSAN